MLLLKVCIFSCWDLSYTSLIQVTPSFSKSMPHPKSYPLSGSTPPDLHLIPSTHRTHDAKWDAALVRCEHVLLLKPQSSTENSAPPAPKRKILRSDIPTVGHKYLFITYIIFICLDPAVQSFWTDGPGINASPLMSGGLHYLYSQTPTLHHPHLRALKVCQQKFPVTQCFGLLPPLIYCHKPRWANNNAISGFDCTL